MNLKELRGLTENKNNKSSITDSVMVFVLQYFGIIFISRYFDIGINYTWFKWIVLGYLGLIYIPMALLLKYNDATSNAILSIYIKLGYIIKIIKILGIIQIISIIYP